MQGFGHLARGSIADPLLRQSMLLHIPAYQPLKLADRTGWRRWFLRGTGKGDRWCQDRNSRSSSPACLWVSLPRRRPSAIACRIKRGPKWPRMQSWTPRKGVVTRMPSRTSTSPACSASRCTIKCDGIFLRIRYERGSVMWMRFGLTSDRLRTKHNVLLCFVQNDRIRWLRQVPTMGESQDLPDCNESGSFWDCVGTLGQSRQPGSPKCLQGNDLKKLLIGVKLVGD